MAEETERERMLHAMYDAWQWLEREARTTDNPPLFAGVARAILSGQLAAAEYPPFVGTHTPEPLPEEIA